MRWAFKITAISLLVILEGMVWAAPSKMITVKDIYTTLKFSGRIPETLQWLPGGKQLSFVKTDETTGMQELWILDAKSRRERAILSEKDLFYLDEEGKAQQVSLSDYQWLNHETGLLIQSEGDLFYYDFNTEKLKRLTRTDAVEEDVALSPDDQWASFVRDNNLYIVSLESGAEKQLTFDGEAHLLNGKKDWVYQEELGSRGHFKGYWWSPDSRHIAYYQMDDRPVPAYPLIDYTVLHPEVTYMRYPKAGDPNPIVKVGVVNIADGQQRWMDLGQDTNVYFPRVYWLPNSQQLAVMRLDRAQQHLDFLFTDVSTGASHVVLSESNPYWINIGDFVYFFKNKKQFIWGSEQSGYNHLYLYDYNGTLLQPLTQGNWAVTSLEGVDENKGLVYYVSTEKDLLERQLYVVNLKGQDKTMLTVKEGFHEIRMAPHAKYYLDDFSAPLIPGQISMHQADGKFLADVNVRKAPDYSEYNLVMPEYFTIKSDSGLTYHASMIKPPDFDPAKKYPVLVYVYGGPHSQVVAKDFTNPWHQMMAQKGFIVFMMDNRGTANRGRKWETAIYRDLGRIELIDQLRGISYLKSLPYVDANRINIWGWSYGGYMTLYALTHSDVFRSGAAVAPVTDWRYYDSIYTERYMGLPSENEKGYQESAPLNYAGQLKGKLFLAHGSDDDNVHFQNSIQFIHRLIDSDLLYRFQVYPNQSHSIRSIPDRIQLFQSITRFFESVNQPG